MSPLDLLPVWLQWALLWAAASVIAVWWWHDLARGGWDDDDYPQVRDERGYGRER